jgi:RHH-type proline utilization regulon transcriptional repressor/proline dehydrogenase/delta 1-pyrroline-5-carboxylate dehydrogenase
VEDHVFDDGVGSILNVMIFAVSPEPLSPARNAICASWLADETATVLELIRQAEFSPEQNSRIRNRATQLIESVRNEPLSGLDALMQEYDLSSQEGVALMCLAEALLRIPDGSTADRLIRDKLSQADWETHIGRSQSIFVNASTWGLMLTGRFVQLDTGIASDVAAFVNRLVARSGEPAVRLAVKAAMRILGHQFVMGETVEQAWRRSQEDEYRGDRISFDMLGEAALTQTDADRHFDDYLKAIGFLGEQQNKDKDTVNAPGISVKLTALHPRFEFAQRERVVEELVPRLLELAKAAQARNIGMTIDAEESHQLDLTLDVYARIFDGAAFTEREAVGLVVQAYQKRAPAVLRFLTGLAQRHNRRIPLRLVKGAYWDTEIKHAQEQGLQGYPVFTRKVHTDVSYLACARYLFDNQAHFYPQFATHNAHTLAAVLVLADDNAEFEFQRLHGMGQKLYQKVVERYGGVACRVYAPVGRHEDLLPYLVRRLLENGANTSFVNRITDAAISVEELVGDPLEKAVACQGRPNARIPLPKDLYLPVRENASGLNIADPATQRAFKQALDRYHRNDWQNFAGEKSADQGRAEAVINPADHGDIVGHVYNLKRPELQQTIAACHAAVADWQCTPADDRARRLEQAACLLESHRAELTSLIVREAGRCIPDALDEIREAVDFCYYYARQARERFSEALQLPGPTGESNALSLHGRGIITCISPWNFPLAIFMGQVSAALAAGNGVLAKPAEPTPLIAARAVELLHQAGVPEKVVQLVPGHGGTIGQALIEDERVRGILFTGSTETARHINQTIAARPGPIIPLVAETGGQNVMIVDSSALPEQVVIDVIRSAFNSAGQRCSALRVLFVQEEMAAQLLEMLCGAMDELRIGDPALLSTDIGPVINRGACDSLQAHAARMSRESRLVHRLRNPPAAGEGSFFPPHVFEIDGIDRLSGEVFGPILHLIRYQADKLDSVIDAVNSTGYGLTLGIHSRVQATAQYIARKARVGNIYINRNMIGAVVGVQPFGGEGLSGTGPKAGGPDYLGRLAVERTVSDNISAVGGNAQLLSLGDD